MNLFIFIVITLRLSTCAIEVQVSKDDFASPIRLEYNLENFQGEFDSNPSVLELWKDSIIPAVSNYLRNMISVKHIEGNLRVPIDCTEFPLLEDNIKRCQSQPPRLTCNGAAIPLRYIDTYYVCSTPTKCTLTSSTELTAMDLLILLHIDGSENKSSQICYRATDTMRPIVSMITLPKTVATSTNSNPRLLIKILLEMSMYALGWDDFDNYRGYDRIPYDNVIEHKMLSGLNVPFLVTPNAKIISSNHFGCNDIIGVPLYEITTKRYRLHTKAFLTDLMSGYNGSNATLSTIAWGVLKDSGWYNLEHGVASELMWMNQKIYPNVCAIMDKPCVSNYNDVQNASVTDSFLFCHPGLHTERGCTADNKSLAYCELLDLPEMAECPIWSAYENVDESSLCEYLPESYRYEGYPNQVGKIEYLGANSRCNLGDLNINILDPGHSQSSACFNRKCISNLLDNTTFIPLSDIPRTYDSVELTIPQLRTGNDFPKDISYLVSDMPGHSLLSNNFIFGAINSTNVSVTCLNWPCANDGIPHYGSCHCQPGFVGTFCEYDERQKATISKNLSYGKWNSVTILKQREYIFIPTYDGVITSFASTRKLPNGLYVNPENGTIYGYPEVATNHCSTYIMLGWHEGISISTSFQINIVDEIEDLEAVKWHDKCNQTLIGSKKMDITQPNVLNVDKHYKTFTQKIKHFDMEKKSIVSIDELNLKRPIQTMNKLLKKRQEFDKPPASLLLRPLSLDLAVKEKFESIRIKIELERSLENQLNSLNKCWECNLKAVNDFLQRVIKVQRLMLPLKIKTRCARHWTLTGKKLIPKCKVLEPPSRQCGGMNLKSLHREPILLCPNSRSTCKLTGTTGRGESVDFISYLGVSDIYKESDTGNCLRNLNGRPLAGYSWLSQDYFTANVDNNVEIQSKIAQRLLVQLGWLNQTSISHAKSLSQEAKSPVAFDDYQQDNFINYARLNTPKSISYSNKYFGCTNLGLPLSAMSYDDDKNVAMYLHPIAANGDVIGYTSVTGNLVSPLSTSMLEDFDFYKIDELYLNNSSWANSQLPGAEGCKIITEKCIQENRSILDSQFCTSNADMGSIYCTFDYSNTAYCNLETRDQNIPSNYQYFAATDIGGLPEMNYCPIYYPASNAVENIDRNTDAVAKKCTVFRKDDQIQTKMRYATCSIDNQKDNLIPNDPFHIQWIQADITYINSNNDQTTVTCDFMEENTWKTIEDGYEILCPELSRFCFNYPCKNGGTPRLGVCICTMSYFGKYCEIPVNNLDQLLPTTFSYYKHTGLKLLENHFIEIGPHYNGILKKFTINPQLPEGLSFDEYTGYIAGTPTDKGTEECNTYTIVGISDNYEIPTFIKIKITSMDSPQGNDDCENYASLPAKKSNQQTKSIEKTNNNEGIRRFDFMLPNEYKSMK